MVKFLTSIFNCLVFLLLADTVRTEDGEILAKFNHALASIVTTEGWQQIFAKLTLKKMKLH